MGLIARSSSLNSGKNPSVALNQRPLGRRRDMRPWFSRSLPVTAMTGAFAALCGPAYADCNEDLGKLMKERDAIIGQLNAMSGAGGKKKPLDPIAACPKLKSLAAVSGRTVAYFEKNKEWCTIPDNVIEQARAQRNGFAKTAGQACNVAAQVQQAKKNAEKQAAQGGAPYQQKLPEGPL